MSEDLEFFLEVLFLGFESLEFADHFAEFIDVYLHHLGLTGLGSMLCFIHFGFDALGEIIYTSLVRFFLAEALGGHSDIFVLCSSVVLTIFFGKMYGGILQYQ